MNRPADPVERAFAVQFLQTLIGCELLDEIHSSRLLLELVEPVGNPTVIQRRLSVVTRCTAGGASAPTGIFCSIRLANIDEGTKHPPSNTALHNAGEIRRTGDVYDRVNLVLDCPEQRAGLIGAKLKRMPLIAANGLQSVPPIRDRELKPTHSELRAMCGITRAAVSRMLSQLNDEGTVELKYGRFNCSI